MFRLAAKLAEVVAVSQHFICLPNVFRHSFTVGKYSRFRLKIVDDDVDWQHMVKAEEVVEEEEEEDEAPVVCLFANRVLRARSC